MLRPMKRTLCPIALLSLLALTSMAAETPTPVPLWPDGAPGALGKEAKDIPTITPYLPAADKANGAAMVICPGGGYAGLAAHEGNDYALYLNQQGITCFVLKYRLGSQGYRHPSMLQDAARAVPGITNSEGAEAGFGRMVATLVTSAGFAGRRSRSFRTTVRAAW